MTTHAYLACIGATLLIASQPVAAKDSPQQIAVIVNAMVNSSPGDRFVEVDTKRSEAAKDVEKALRKSSDLLLKKRKGESVPTVLIILGIKDVRVTTGAALRPDLPSMAAEVVWVIDTQDIVTPFSKPDAEPYIRSVTFTGIDRPAAADMVAKDLIAWVEANRSRLLAKD